MNPIGIGLAFLVFWSLVAVGTFLLLAASRRLRRAAGRGPAGEAAAHLTVADGVAIGVFTLQGLLGAVMIASGLYATYIVLLAR